MFEKLGRLLLRLGWRVELANPPGSRPYTPEDEARVTQLELKLETVEKSVVQLSVDLAEARSKPNVRGRLSWPQVKRYLEETDGGRDVPRKRAAS